MKHFISRRNFLKAAGVTAAASAMAAAVPQASAGFLTGKDAAVTILYTNDVHTYIDNKSPKLTYAAIAAMKQGYVDEGKPVLLVDAGDHIQGTAYGSMDDGATIIELMNEAGYDIATLGNHEFDYGMARAKAIIKEADFPYVSCNWVDLRTGLRVLPAVKLFPAGGKWIAFVGITTPESFTKSTPAYFMNAKQTKYIYDILGGDDGRKLYDAVQKAIDKAKTLGADIIIGLGHLGVDPSSSPWTSEEVIANTTGFDAFIDGHSHTVMENKQVQDASGKAVTLTQTGSYLANVGKMTIAEDGAITTELISTADVSDAAVAATAEAWINDVDAMLGEQIATTDIKFYINDPATGKRRIRMGETNLGDFVADGIYTYFNEVEQLDCDIAMMNGGGIRTDVDAGKWTFKTCKQVSPFGNVACLMSVTGKQIQDALEFGARFVGPEGKENGGFLQVVRQIFSHDKIAGALGKARGELGQRVKHAELERRHVVEKIRRKEERQVRRPHFFVNFAVNDECHHVDRCRLIGFRLLDFVRSVGVDAADHQAANRVIEKNQCRKSNQNNMPPGTDEQNQIVRKTRKPGQNFLFEKGCRAAGQVLKLKLWHYFSSCVLTFSEFR